MQACRSNGILQDASPEDNAKAMTESLSEITTGMVTTAVRDSKIGDTIIHKDDFMAMAPDHKVITSKDLKTAFFNLLEQLVTDDTEVISVYYGANLDEETCKTFVKEAEANTKTQNSKYTKATSHLYPLFVSAE